MDNQEINERIAEKRDAIPKENPDWHEVTLAHYQDAPDYINDPALNLEMVVELMDNGWFCGRNTMKKYIWKKADANPRSKKIFVVDEDFGTATCLAWLEEFT